MCLHLQRPIVIFFMSEMFHRYQVFIINLRIKRKATSLVENGYYQTQKIRKWRQIGADSCPRHFLEGVKNARQGRH